MLAFLLFLLYSLIFTNITLAHELLVDNFNGNTELNQYNNLYKKINDSRLIIGTLTLNTDHIETTGNDPAYIYSGTSEENKCASLDFNWLNGNQTGHWTNIIFHSTEDHFGTAFQIRNDDQTHQRWVLFNLEGEYLSGPVSFDESITHNIKVCLTGSEVFGYLDNNLLFNGNDSGYIQGYMGFASQSPTYYLDNFKIEDYLPTQLNVPLIKQTESAWNNILYDSANAWSPNNNIIGSWGCALTSAVMVFHYHNITQMPDNSPLTPESVNKWLKEEPDGYINEGWVNWMALSRLSKKAKSANPLFSFDALEYKRFQGFNKSQLTIDLLNSIPDILQVPGHFIVAKGIEGSTFSINDPYYSRSLLTDYNNTFKNIGRFTPSNTDLSYLLLYSDSNTKITVRDSMGNLVGTSNIEEPFENVNHFGQTNGQAFSMFLLDKPSSDIYSIILESTQTHMYTLTSLLYDDKGEVIKNNYSGSLGNRNEIYTINYNKEKNKLSKILHISNYDSVINDIRELEANDLIYHIIADDLVLIINKAKNPQGINLKGSSFAALGTFREVISKNKGKGIDVRAYEILFSDVKELMETLI